MLFGSRHTLLAVAMLAMLLPACERADRRLGPVVRLNEVAGDADAHAWPDYTEILRCAMGW